MILQFEISTGRITQWIEAPDEHLIHYQSESLGAILVPDTTEKVEGWVEDEVIFPIPSKPSGYHEFNWTSKTWTESVDSLTSSKAKAKSKLLNHFSTLRYGPILLGEAYFDADNNARSNIQGLLFRLIRGEGLTNGWIGWKDFENEMHWVNDNADTVTVHLSELSSEIENRDQFLIIKHWIKKQEVEALQTLPEVLNYLEFSIEEGWQ